MRKVLGLAGLLAALIAAVCIWQQARQGDITFITGRNVRNLLAWVGLFGVLSLGQAFVIITGGIDLSVGSIVALVGIVAAELVAKGEGWSAGAAVPLVLLMCLAIGAWHGLLVTKGRMQPFVVTLCGLFFYRGIARVVSNDQSRGFGNAEEHFPFLDWLANGYLPNEDGILPVAFVLFLFLALVAGLFQHQTPYGRHLFALGASEESARFSGVRTERLKILAYMLCTFFAGIGGLLFAFNINSFGASTHGNFYELYAIAGVVLGGCSLRGGSGNFLGVVVGAALIQVLRNLVNILQIPSQLEYVVIGGAILAGVFVDELLTRRSKTASGGS